MPEPFVRAERRLQRDGMSLMLGTTGFPLTIADIRVSGILGRLGKLIGYC